MSLIPPKRLFHIPTMLTVFYKDVADDVKKKGYIAVSHVWGTQQMFIASELGVLGGVDWKIPLSDPNKVSRLVDAMNHYGVEYCWWDILCMPQDKHDEINLEIPFMGDYYSGAYATIVLSDVEYNTLEDLDKWLKMAKDVNDKERSLTLEETEWINSHPNLLDTSKDQWFERVWTFQETVLSKLLVMVDAGGSIVVLSLIFARLRDMKSLLALPFVGTKIIETGFSIRARRLNTQNLVRVIDCVIQRKCYKQQDIFYGILGVLGYKNFLVDYSISMEDLNGKIIQYAYSMGDISWISVYAGGKTFIQPIYRPYQYLDMFDENNPEKYGVKFEKDILYIDATRYAEIVDYKNLDEFTDSDRDKQGLFILKNWGFDVNDIVSFTTRTVISDAKRDMFKIHINAILEDLNISYVQAKNYNLYGLDSITDIAYLMATISIAFLEGTVLVKAIMDGTGEEIICTIMGNVNIGDQIMLTKIRNNDVSLGFVIDGFGRNKGICSIRKTLAVNVYEKYKLT